MKSRDYLLIISIGMNVIMFVVLFCVLDHKTQIEKTQLYMRTVSDSYLDNPQYNARFSMFEISKRDSAKIVFAGDSITAFGNFNEFFNEKDIVNRGIGSDVSEGLYNRIDQIIELRPKMVFIMIGINDIKENVAIDQTKQYCKLTCEKIKNELPNTQIYLLSILPTMTADEQQVNNICSINKWYELYCRDNQQIEYVNLYPLYLDDLGKPNESLYSKDGVHLNGDGYKVWVEAVSTYIDE